MWNSLRKFLSPPVFEGQREKTRHARLLHYGILIIFVFSIVLYWLNWTIGTEAEREQTWILGLLSLALIPAYFLIRAGYVKEVSFFLLTALWVIMTSFGRYVAGIHDIAMMVYFLIMLVLCCLSAKWKNGIHVIVHKRSQNHEKKAQALQSGRKSSFT
ncbi:MAG: hypothetical protein HN916_07825, partial [Anaerolineae bacterium]|nr:hypothetical protein [Anaerolineae bacterium]